MRIISGTLASRMFDSPGTHKTHPMSDRMRGALFNILGDIQGLTVLDPFAGSGALSFEAVSRGALSAIAIDHDRTAQKTIAHNIAALGLKPQVKLIKASANAWLATNPNTQFDLVLCDPPYDALPAPSLLDTLAAAVRPRGLFVLSWPPELIPQIAGLEQLDQRSYGDGQLIFYRRSLPAL